MFIYTFASFELAERTSIMRTANFVGLISAVLIGVIGVSLATTVVGAAEDVLDITDLATNFPLVATITPFIPVVYIAAVMGLVGGIGYLSVRPKRG